MNSGNTFRLGVLGSGKGSNFVAIADAIAAQLGEDEDDAGPEGGA